MGDGRIKVAKDKAELVQRLLASDQTTGPFQTYADIVVFAAAIGFKYNRKVALEGEFSKRDPAPIHRETFASKGYEMVLNLISIADSLDPKILVSDNNTSSEKLAIFEEYVNGGLEVLSDLLRGTLDYSDKLILEIDADTNVQYTQDLEFDLSKFI
jgi:dnd system-associated protein 4